MRSVVIEEVANGFVVRHRVGEEMAALVFEGESALRQALTHVRAFYMVPVDSADGSSPSFGMLPALKRPKGATTALERKHRTPLPTESIAPKTPADAPTVRLSKTEIAKALADNDPDLPPVAHPVGWRRPR